MKWKLSAMWKKLHFYLFSDRIGPDMIFTHWMLYSQWLVRFFFKKRFYSFGKNVEIRPGSYLLNTRTICLGDNVVIRPLSYIAGETLEHTKAKPSIIIEDDVLLSPGVHMYPSNHIYSDSRKPIMYQGDSSTALVRIKSGAWIGANAILLPGVIVGRNAVVAAGAVVSRNVPDYSIAFGNPVKMIRYSTKA